MSERFPDEFVTWHHKTPPGIKVDEVFGMDSKTGRVWIELARQIYSEQGEPNYRIIDHFENGAPFIEGYPGRVSITHTKHFFAAAILPKTPEVNLAQFNTRSAMGIDAESLDRSQVLKLRDKFLSPAEQEFIKDEDLVANIMAWTAKEALYKAGMTPGLDIRENLIIKSLPPLSENPEEKGEIKYGEATIRLPENGAIASYDMKLYSYESYGCCVTLAFSPKTARFGK